MEYLHNPGLTLKLSWSRVFLPDMRPVKSVGGSCRYLEGSLSVGNNMNSPIRTSAVVLLQHFATSLFLAS
jgi:hypothetical protein